MGMSYEELENALAKQGKTNLEQRAEIERLRELIRQNCNPDVVRIACEQSAPEAPIITFVTQHWPDCHALVTGHGKDCSCPHGRG